LLYTQNRDSKAIHFKLNELILNDRNARNKLLAIEEDTEDAIKEIGKEFKEIKNSSMIFNFI
jgi:low affinity Fe/Cu permease